MSEQGSGRTPANRLSCWLGTGALLLVPALLIIWWRSPVLPHTFPTAVEHLDRQIRTAGGADILPSQYAAFHQKVSDIRQHWRVETNRWWPSLTLEAFTESYQQLMHSGATLLTAVEKKKISHQDGLKDLLKEEQSQLARLRRLNGLFDLRGKRTTLSRAESFLSQGLPSLLKASSIPSSACCRKPRGCHAPRRSAPDTSNEPLHQWAKDRTMEAMGGGHCGTLTSNGWSCDCRR